MRTIFYAISAFTLAHSVTLVFGVLNILSVRVLYVEAMIALSIMFLARELLSPTETYTKQHLSIVAFVFGLLHGFGFSSSLRDIGLPQDEIPLSLLAFNIGIELGQVIFILLISYLLYKLKKYVKDISTLKIFIAYIIGILSTYWFIQRVLVF